MNTIKNNETVEPGTLVINASRGQVVREVLETRKRTNWLEGRLRDTRTGRSVGWHYLDKMARCDADGKVAL